MGKFRVRFTEPQRVGDVMPPDVLVSEVVVEADRLVLVREGTEVQLDVGAETVAELRPVSEEAPRKTRERAMNDGAAWTEHEIESLRAAWETGPKTAARVKELASLHGRSVGAIRSRLKALGLVTWS